MTDELDPRAVTWTRTAPAPTSITQAPAYWRHLAATDFKASPDLAADYVRLAEMTERYLELRGGRLP